MAVVALSLIASSSTFAADDSNNDDEAWKGEFSLGLLLNEGNTKSKTIKTGFIIGQDKEKWRFGAEFKSLSETKDEENTAERYSLKGKIDYKFTEKDYAFLYSSYDEDRFTAFEYQATISAGYGRRLIDNETHEWDVEVGPGYRLDELKDGSNNEEAIVRLATKYTHKFSETSTFIQNLNVDAGSHNTFTQSETALKVMINATLALKLSYFIKYNETLPEGDESKHYDKETSVSVLYTF